MNEIEKHYARVFNTPSGKQVLNHLRTITKERVMGQIATNEELRNSLIEKGRRQRQKFSWQLTSERLWNCIENAIK